MRTMPTTVTVAFVLSLCASLTAQAAPAAGDPPALPKPATQTAAAPAAPAVAPVVAPAAAPAAVAPAAPAAVAPAAPAAVPVAVQERFRTYAGPRTPAALSGLFRAPVSAGVRQLPELVLSNGALPVNIAVSVPGSANEAPNFAFNGARLISSTLTGKDEWLIVALPETGTTQAELIILSSGAAREIPLAVAPPLPAGTDLSEKGFITFLGNTAPGSKPLQDLNGDGRRDYIDDYIFTANYLAGKLSPVAERSTDAEESRTAQPPKPGEPDYDQRFRDFQTSEAARAAEQKGTGEGQSSVPAFGSGWGSGAGAPATTGGAPATTGSYSVTPGGTSPAATSAAADAATSAATSAATGATPTDGTQGVYTITSPSGKTLTYYGTQTPSRLNMRNLGAKEATDALKNVK